MTKDEYRRQLEEQDLEQLVGTARRQEVRDEVVSWQVQAYQVDLERQGDKELLGPELYDRVRRQAIERKLAAFNGGERE